MSGHLKFRGKAIGGQSFPAVPWAEREAAWAKIRAEKAMKPQTVPASVHSADAVVSGVAPSQVDSVQSIPQRSPEWHAARIGRVTASVAGACLGLNPYVSRAQAWRTIKGIEPNRYSEHIERGIAREDAICRLYEARQGVKVDKAGLVIHKTLSWICASPDGLVGPMGLVEIKCPVHLPEEIPTYHRIQCMVQLACTDRWYCDYFAHDGKDVYEYRVLRDVHTEYAMLMSLWDFYVRYVQADVEPPVTHRLKLGMPWLKSAGTSP